MLRAHCILFVLKFNKAHQIQVGDEVEFAVSEVSKGLLVHTFLIVHFIFSGAGNYQSFTIVV